MRMPAHWFYVVRPDRGSGRRTRMKDQSGKARGAGHARVHQFQKPMCWLRSPEAGFSKRRIAMQLDYECSWCAR